MMLSSILGQFLGETVFGQNAFSDEGARGGAGGGLDGGDSDDGGGAGVSR